MSADNTIKNSSSSKMLIAMVGIGIVCALLIVFTFEQTLPVIERNKKEALQKAIFKVVPNTTQTKTFQLVEGNKLEPLTEGETDNELVYAGYNDKNEFQGLAIEGRGQGYADIIGVLYGYHPQNQEVVGFYVLETKETPGLGDKIEKDENFLANFKKLDVQISDDGKALKNEVVTVKNGDKTNAWQIDGITGATISSRAIGNIINSSAAFWAPIIQKNKVVFSNQTKTEKEVSNE